ncbi:MAG: HAMP domain-containing sensor histidine kinase [Pseudomonadota bacterium]
MGRLRLRTRYAVLLSALMVVSALLVSIVHITDSWRTEEVMQESSSDAMQRALMREVEQDWRALASMLADSLIDPLVADDFESMANIVGAALRLPNVTNVLLYGGAGTIVHDGTDEISGYGKPAIRPVAVGVLDNGSWRSAVRDGSLELAAPIAVDDHLIGAIYLEIDLSRSLGHIEQLDEELDGITEAGLTQSIVLTLIVTALMCAGGIIAAQALAARFSSPILDLAWLTKRIGAGEYRTRVHWRRRDELGELSESLHRMAETLEQTTVSKAELEVLISERTQALARANRELRRLDRSRRRFFAEISHELRTPLTVIRGEADVALRSRQPTPKDYRAALVRIIDLSKQLSKLVDDLLFIARAEIAPLPIDNKPLDLDRRVRAACDDMRVLARDEGVSIEHVPTDEHLQVRGDDQRLGQLLMILLDNAIKHNGSGTRITLHLEREADDAILTVRDDGAGVAAQEIDRVFDPFFRGAEARAASDGGSGLGLAVAKQIVQAHRGTIAMTSEPANGTTVTVRLPLATDAPSNEEESKLGGQVPIQTRSWSAPQVAGG